MVPRKRTFSHKACVLMVYSPATVVQSIRMQSYENNVDQSGDQISARHDWAPKKAILRLLKICDQRDRVLKLGKRCGDEHVPTD